MFFDTQIWGFFLCPRCGEEIDLNEFDDDDEEFSLDINNLVKDSYCPNCGCFTEAPLRNIIDFENSERGKTWADE